MKLASKTISKFLDTASKDWRIITTAFLVLAMILLLLGYQTTHNYYEVKRRLSSATDQLHWMKKHQHTSFNNSVTISAHTTELQPISDWIEEAARKNRITLSSYTTDSRGNVSVKVEAEPFNNIIQFMNDVLQHNKLVLTSASIRRHDEQGKVQLLANLSTRP